MGMGYQYSADELEWIAKLTRCLDEIGACPVLDSYPKVQIIMDTGPEDDAKTIVGHWTDEFTEWRYVDGVPWNEEEPEAPESRKWPVTVVLPRRDTPNHE